MKLDSAISMLQESAAASANAQQFSTDDLARRVIERRAVEAVIWGMPAVNLDLMLQAIIGSAKGKPNQIVYWSRRGTDGCGRTSASSRPSTMPSPPSTRPSDATGRRSSAFVRERHAPIDARGRAGAVQIGPLRPISSSRLSRTFQGDICAARGQICYADRFLSHA
jgi:hypothetical protein